MSRASSSALKHPPVTAPSEPAGAPSPFPELAVAIERERRRGRGAQSNASGRFEAEARVAFDDGWQSLDELPPFKTTVALDTARKVITRNDSPDIGFDRSITLEPARSTKRTSRTTPAAAPGTSAARVATAVCSIPSVGIMTLSINEASLAQSFKTLHCYHLVILKTAVPLQLFQANADDPRRD